MSSLEPGDGVARPAWPGAAPQQVQHPEEAHGKRRRWAIDLKLVVAVLIGLVSVTGAIMTWQSSQLGEYATDKDRQAIAETVRQQQDEANNEIILQDARGRVAAHAAALTNAEQLEEQAARFVDAGDDGTATVLSEQAAEERAVARSYLQTSTAPVALADYVVVSDDTGHRVLDEASLARDLEEISSSESRVDPSQTVREANRLRRDSQRLDGWVIALVAAIVLLTLAQVSRMTVLRLGLTGIATVVWIGSTVIAFGGS